MNAAVLESPVRLKRPTRRVRRVVAAKPLAPAQAISMTSETSDADFVVRARAGDQDAFRGLVERYQQRAFWVARRMLSNDEDARDAAQEAFVRVHRSLERFDTSMRFYTWLYQIVVNLCIDHLRKNAKRRAASLDAVGDVEGRGADPCALEGAELKQRVALVLDHG